MAKSTLGKRALVSALLVLLAFAGMAQTTFTLGDLNYQVNNDGVSVTVTGYVSGQGGELYIPESVRYDGNDYAVTAIGDNAFLYGYFTGSLTIPNSVTTIGDAAFAYCCNLSGDLVIPNSVTSIGASAFQICFGFDGTLTLGNALTVIGDYAFNSCDGLRGVVNIPSSVVSVSGNTFGYCNLDGFTVEPGNSVYDSREECNAIIATATNELIAGCRNTVIPPTVTSIGEDAFKGCQGLTSIVLPESVVSIGDGAFSFCYGLTGSLTIPNSVTTIGAGAFFYCNALNGTLTIGKSVAFIGDYAFRNCSGFTEAVSLAATVPELGNEPGWGCVVFEGFGTQTLTVPYGCAEAYQNSPWYDPIGLNGFSLFIEESDAVTEAGQVPSAVYPNPTQGVVKIEAEGLQSISIFNILGEKVFEGAANSPVFEYDFGPHQAGMYLILVETAQGTATKRVNVL